MLTPRSKSLTIGGPANVWLATKLAVKPICCGVALLSGDRLGWLLRATPKRNELTRFGEIVYVCRNTKLFVRRASIEPNPGTEAPFGGPPKANGERIFWSKKL